MIAIVPARPAMRRVVKSGGVKSLLDCSDSTAVSARHAGQLVRLIRPPLQGPTAPHFPLLVPRIPAAA
jgi:hypothetical protein